jgi:adenosylcobinamide hydrolase
MRDRPPLRVDSDQPQFFKVRVEKNTLLVTFPGPRSVMSWAILNGGVRTHASHIINHHVDPHSPDPDPRRTLRQAASRIGIKGTFVGMLTGANVQRFSMARATHNELQAYVISTAGCGNLATVGETGNYVEGASLPAPAGTINVIVVLNYGFTDEAMLEATSIVTEAKVRAMYELGLKSVATGKPATGTGTDCTAVAVGHDRRYIFCGKHTKWGELVGRASLESIRGAIRLARPGDQADRELKSARDLTPKCESNLSCDLERGQARGSRRR